MTDVPFVVATGCCNYLQAHFLSLESRSSVSQKYRYTDGSGEKHCGVFCKIIAFVCVVRKCCSKKYAEEDQDKEVGTMKKIVAAFPVFCKMKVFRQMTSKYNCDLQVFQWIGVKCWYSVLLIQFVLWDVVLKENCDNYVCDCFSSRHMAVTFSIDYLQK